MWGIIPAAGAGTRIQPLAFSKELLPVGSHFEDGTERPRAVSEYLVDRMICFVISPGKADILQYYGAGVRGAHTAYVVQPRPGGLCDAIFRAAPLVSRSEPVLIGLPDTIWFPEAGFAAMPDDVLSFLLFPVKEPQHFDAVVLDPDGGVVEVQVKQPKPSTHWVWGAIKMPGSVFHLLRDLWLEPGRNDEYFGTLVNAYLARGGRARGLLIGESYVDVGTLNGYRQALQLLGSQATQPAAVNQASPLNDGLKPLTRVGTEARSIAR